ncbi:tyrosine-protein kinase receptor Tie-1-like isoform X2 [Anneissia japonica]|uniref:tyrosine-protein kinase receptor Tie-1-like isoform X2 n=1 Tax=Anneissia japonica TaxID=1529436 RepID=UPI0014259808|nr:tyrosine-protein kinase receptor Tie-1-like isoform X2 [Anneissia japonica]
MARWYSLIYFFIILQSIYAQENKIWVLTGDSVTFTVPDVDETSINGLVWEKDRNEIYEWANQDVRNLTNVTVEDSGNYECYYSNPESSEADLQLLKRFSLDVIERKLDVIIFAGLEVNENQFGNAKCVIQGDPLPNTDQVWLQTPDGGRTKPTDYVVHAANFTVEMEFTEINVWNKKKYTCSVGTDSTSVNQSIYGQVYKTPRLHLPPNVVVTNDSLTVSWKAWPDTDIGEIGDGPIVKYSVLYNCTNSSSKYIGAGVDGSTTSMDVFISELSIKRGYLCTFFAIPSRPGNGGEGPFMTGAAKTVYIPCLKPHSSPTDVRVTLNGTDTIQVDWEGISNNDWHCEATKSYLVMYHIISSPTDSFSQEVDNHHSTAELKVDNGCATYVISVAAKNQDMTGVSSTAVNVSTTDSCIRISVVAVSDKHVTIALKTPNTTVDLVNSYKVTYQCLYRLYERAPSHNTTIKTSIFQADTNMFTVTGLQSACHYNFTIERISKSSLVTSDTFSEDTLPPPALGKPKLIVLNKTATTITVKFKPLDNYPYIRNYSLLIMESSHSIENAWNLTFESKTIGATAYTTAQFPPDVGNIYFTIGTSDVEDDLYNAPLDPKKSYYVSLAPIDYKNKVNFDLVEWQNGTISSEIESQPSVQSSSLAIGPMVLGLFGLITFLVLVILGLLVYFRRRGSHKFLEQMGSHRPTHPQEYIDMLTANRGSEFYEDICDYTKIAWEDLMIDAKVIGRGNFGEVRLGLLKHEGKNKQVAIKTLAENAVNKAKTDFLTELNIMAMIGDHENVIHLIGACINEGTLYVAMEYAKHGNLLTYLKLSREEHLYSNSSAMRSKDDHFMSSISSDQLLKFCWDIAKGMDHLTSRGVIHRDLAARNVLLDHNLTAKVSDFGLSRDENMYVMTTTGRVPVKWMAPESIMYQTYTSKSDV